MGFGLPPRVTSEHTPPEVPVTEESAKDEKEEPGKAPGSARRRRRRKRGKSRRRVFDGRRPITVLPTAFTLANLLCGFLAIFMASRPVGTPTFFGNWTPLTAAAVFVFIGLACDALDGRVARLTNTTSDLGAQLDSMADMVCFGVAPAFILVQVIGVQAPFFFEQSLESTVGQGDTFFDRLGLVIACIYVACAGLRLARFNLEVEGDEVRHHMSFNGLPSPGAAGAVASMTLLHQQIWARDAQGFGADLAAYVLLFAALLCAVAMVSGFRYVHLMNRYLRDQAPFTTLVTGVIVLLLLLIWPQPVLAVGFVAYVFSAPVLAVWPGGAKSENGDGA
ncbi:MAG: phosphatidylcholine/phosphatidylserine synthase [Algisphaera sp.]